MNPKAFISYSWSSPAHQEWVLRLAIELRESGVDVTLDKWDLKEGHDAHAFMEQMVTDPTIEKVIMVCNKAYTEKANGRSGGVGTEAQIITPELYGKQRQDKFVAIIAERDDEGSAYLPAFFKSRIYIDMSNDAVYSEGFTQLLRWAFGKPLHVKPKLGVMPGFLTSATGRPNLPTAAKFRRAVDLLRGGQPYATAAASEYFSTLVESLEELRIRGADFTVDTFDDAVVKTIDEFLPYRAETVTLFALLASYAAEDEVIDVLHRFFEGLIPYMDRPEEVTIYQEWDYDNFRFIGHEIFLYAVAILIRNGKFSATARFLETDYYIRTGTSRGEMKGYAVFMKGLRSLECRKQRLGLHRISIQADMLKERCKGLPVEFRDLMQADFVVFLHARLAGGRWHPLTAVFIDFRMCPFEIFARAKSKRYFSRIAPMLGASGVASFQAGVKKLAADPRNLPQWDYHTLPVAEATGIDEIGTTA